MTVDCYPDSGLLLRSQCWAPPRALVEIEWRPRAERAFYTSIFDNEGMCSRRHGSDEDLWRRQQDLNLRPVD